MYDRVLSQGAFHKRTSWLGAAVCFRLVPGDQDVGSGLVSVSFLVAVGLSLCLNGCGLCLRRTFVSCFSVFGVRF